MKSPTVYVLAGGLGTRLAHIVRDVPKPMARVSGKPFLEWQVLWLARQGFTDIVLLTGHMHEVIQEYFQDGRQFSVTIRYSVEAELLGTGGAVLQALNRFPAEEYVILNGDTFFDIPLEWLIEYRRSSLPRDSVCMALKYSGDVRRYGRVSLDSSYAITAFLEKSESQGDGYINGGIYVAGAGTLQHAHAGKTSMEMDIFPGLAADRKLYGVPFGGKFIDIGVEEAYRLADASIAEWFHRKKKAALFMDRDGILIEDTGYVKDPDSLVFYEEFFKLARKAQDKGFAVIVISNQAGVAKGCLRVEDVEAVNSKIGKKFKSHGVQPAGFYWCPYHEEGELPEWTRSSLLRKPEPGMVLKAVEDLDIDPLESLMIGDKDTDRIKLPYLRTAIVAGRYPVDDIGDIADVSQLAAILDCL